MIKKIILKKATQSIINRSKLRKFIGRGGKIQKFKAQPAPIKSGKWTDVDADMRARSKFDEIFDSSEDNIYQGVKILSVRKAAAESLASKTAIKKWNRSLPKHIKRERSAIASRVRTWRQQNLASGQVNPVVKRSIKKAKVASFIKTLDRKDLQFEKIRSKTSQLFTGRSGKNPLQHKLTETKFITTKKFKKGKMDEWSESMMPGKGWHGESFAKVSGAAHYERQRRSDWFKKPEVIEALAKGKTTKSKVYGAWLKDEAKRRREFAIAFSTKKKKK
tara:strand:+ start:2660 stop:3487 length:828 start_codon:yes stop_codon:yes gene_type:complete